VAGPPPCACQTYQTDAVASAASNASRVAPAVVPVAWASLPRSWAAAPWRSLAGALTWRTKWSAPGVGGVLQGAGALTAIAYDVPAVASNATCR
jgi:hypothetical protein